MRLATQYLFAISLIIGPTTWAQQNNITQQSVDKAQEIVAKAVEAHGGADNLQNINTVVVEHRTTQYATNQSRKPGPPWDKSINLGVSAIDKDKGHAFIKNTGETGGFEYNAATLISGDDNYQLDYRAGTKTVIAQPNYVQAAGPFLRVTAPLLVDQLRSRVQTAVYLGTAKDKKTTYDVVSFSMESGPAISLYFDPETYLLAKSERVLGAIGLVEYWFDDYETIEGVQFNRSFYLKVRGEPNLDRKNEKIAVNTRFADIDFATDDLAVVEAAPPQDFSRTEIAPGVYQIGGAGTYAMFVELKDRVVAIGGTAGIAQRIESVKEVVGDKPISHGVITHHHNDHVVGVSDYEQEGAKVVASKAHSGVVKDAAQDAEQLELILVDKEMELGDEGKSIKIIDVGPTAHSEHLLIAYLPQEQILFQADSFNIPPVGGIPPAVSSTRTFAEALRKKGIRFKKMMSSHGAIAATPDDLQRALNAKSKAR